MSLFPEDAPYRVLARKYRPDGFDTLLGQDAVVQTLANSIRSNRLAQAWLLTGVRGVGKTSTARIIAKALNCIGEDGTGGPTIEPCGVCANCTAIAAGQHIDVIEMDAASNTGVDNIREIIEAVRYASVSARYKVYIIDEVHMLSKGAFNALLKTLEEPPPHVKFIFATTEVQNLPATILSRCQRFDLRRVSAELLAGHFARICDAEGVEADKDALDIIARMAEGSVRDGLSILDQAIALADGARGGKITADVVRDMLGLADRGRAVGLLQALVKGEAGNALALLDAAHDAGVEPDKLFEELLDLVHLITRTQAAGTSLQTLSAEDQAALSEMGSSLGFATLHRLWQLLLKALEDIAQAPVQRQAADMAALRIAHAAHFPDPEKLARTLTGGAVPAGTPAALPSSASAGPVAAIPVAVPEVKTPAIDPSPRSAEELVALFADRREAMLAKQLHDDVGVVEISDGVLRLATRLDTDFARQVSRFLEEWTDKPWQVELEPPREDILSQHQQEGVYMARLLDESMQDPRVIALVSAFPGAQVQVEPLEKRSRTA